MEEMQVCVQISAVTETAIIPSIHPFLPAYSFLYAHDVLLAQFYTIKLFLYYLLSHIQKHRQCQAPLNTGCFQLCDRNRHEEVKDMVDGLNCILDMGVVVTSGVKIKTPHVVHLEENSLIPLCTLPHSLNTHINIQGIHTGSKYVIPGQPPQRQH